jgi:hypothetical protein
MKYKHEMVKNKDEYDEVEYCIYCGKMLYSEGKDDKVCPDGCVAIEFVTPSEYFHEKIKERKQFNSKGPDCGCKYPLIS